MGSTTAGRFDVPTFLDSMHVAYDTAAHAGDAILFAQGGPVDQVSTSNRVAWNCR